MEPTLLYFVASVTSKGYFSKVLATILLAKVAQIFGDFLDYSEKCQFFR